MWADIEDVVVARLGDLFAPGSCRAGQMPNNPVYPYCHVTRIDGVDDWVTDYPVVDVDLFEKAGRYTQLAALARRVHGRMGRNWTNKHTVVLPGGERVRIDRCITRRTPVLTDYEDDSVVRMVGRYEIENRAQTAA